MRRMCDVSKDTGVVVVDVTFARIVRAARFGSINFNEQHYESSCIPNISCKDVPPMWYSSLVPAKRDEVTLYVREMETIVIACRSVELQITSKYCINRCDAGQLR